jgi:colanic acid/amylovoran biosynthesis glycosyltransferase
MASIQVGYLINQYPKVSHSFIRREILALEELGVKVRRFALRGWDEAVTDPLDLEERRQTQYVLGRGVPGLLQAFARHALGKPFQTWRGLRAAWAMRKGSDRSWPYHVISALEAMQLNQWCQQQGVGHVHAHFGTNSAEIVMLGRVMGGPSYSFTVHGPEEFDKPQALGLPQKIKGSAFVVAISSFGRSQLYRWTALKDWPKAQVVHCGLDASFFEGATLTPPSTSPRLVCIGRLCEQKGQLLLLRAARQVIDRGHALELVLAGDGEMRPEIEAEIAQLKLGAHVSITGWLSGEQVRAQLQACRAMVLPSFAEGLPVVIMEAMALQRPVITTSIAGTPELVEDGQTGWLCPAGDVQRLADAMVACLDSPEHQLMQMGERARLRVQARHDIRQEAQKLLNLLAPWAQGVQGS